VTDAQSADGVWRKSTASQVNGDCVEVAFVAKTVRVRDSRAPHSAVLAFSYTEWRAFLAGACDGESGSPEEARELPGQALCCLVSGPGSERLAGRCGRGR
jgi:Domain of unknown function (DUF397)